MAEVYSSTPNDGVVEEVGKEEDAGDKEDDVDGMDEFRSGRMWTLAARI